MRIYKVTSEKKSLIVAAHNPHQAEQVSQLKKVIVEEINIYDPVIVCQENTQTAK